MRVTSTRVTTMSCCNVTLAWWYVHISDLCIRSSPLLPFRAAIHALQSFSPSHICTGSCLLHAEIHLFMRLHFVSLLMYQPRSLDSPWPVLLLDMYQVSDLQARVLQYTMSRALHSIFIGFFHLSRSNAAKAMRRAT